MHLGFNDRGSCHPRKGLRRKSEKRPDTRIYREEQQKDRDGANGNMHEVAERRRIIPSDIRFIAKAVRHGPQYQHGFDAAGSAEKSE